MLDNPGDVEQHFALQRGRNLVVERLDLRPQRRQGERLTHDAVGAGNLGCRAAGARLHLVDKGDAGSVDEIVGDEGGGDLAVQRMSGDLRWEPLAQSSLGNRPAIPRRALVRRASRIAAARGRATSSNTRAAPRAPAGVRPRCAAARAAISSSSGRNSSARSSRSAFSSSRISSAWRLSAADPLCLGDR